MKRAGIQRIAEIGRVSIGTVDRALKGRAGINETTRGEFFRLPRSSPTRPTLPPARSQYDARTCVSGSAYRKRFTSFTIRCAREFSKKQLSRVALVSNWSSAPFPSGRG